jgi:creatinine amidohydrolase
MAQHHLGFAGSMTLRPSTLIAVLKDMVESLARHGFERFYFINGHGGNIATLAAAFSEIYATRSLGAASNDPPVKELVAEPGCARYRKGALWRC